MYKQQLLFKMYLLFIQGDAILWYNALSPKIEKVQTTFLKNNFLWILIKGPGAAFENVYLLFDMWKYSY